MSKIHSLYRTDNINIGTDGVDYMVVFSIDIEGKVSIFSAILRKGSNVVFPVPVSIKNILKKDRLKVSTPIFDTPFLHLDKEDSRLLWDELTEAGFLPTPKDHSGIIGVSFDQVSAMREDYSNQIDHLEKMVYSLEVEMVRLDWESLCSYWSSSGEKNNNQAKIIMNSSPDYNYPKQGDKYYDNYAMNA